MYLSLGYYLFRSLVNFTYTSQTPLSSAEAPLRKVSGGVKFRGRRRREPLPEATPNMAAIRGRHFLNFVVTSGVRTYVKTMAGTCGIIRLRDIEHLVTNTY